MMVVFGEMVEYKIIPHINEMASSDGNNITPCVLVARWRGSLMLNCSAHLRSDVCSVLIV